MNKERKIDELKIGVVLSYIQIGLNVVIQLIYTPIMIRLLGKSEYGLYNLVGSIVSYLNLFSLGFTGAYLRFSTIKKKENNIEKLGSFNGMFLSLFIVMSAVALISGSILTVYSKKILGENLTTNELLIGKRLMVILVINLAMTFPSSVFNSMIIGEEKFLFQKIVSILATIANPLIVLPLLILGFGSVAVVIVTTVITFISLMTNIWYCLYKLHIPIYFKNFDYLLLKDMGVFSFFLFLNMLIDQINWSVDKLILGRIIGTDAVAEYGAGSQINTMIITFSTAISSVFAPRINRIAVESKEKEKEFTEIFTKVGRIQFMVIFLITTGFVFFGRYFIENIYAGKEYKSTYAVALLLIIPGIVPLIQNLGIEIQRSVNKHKFRSIMYFIMAIINIIISIPLAKMFGPIGAALGTSISLIIMNIMVMNLYYHTAIGIDICFFWKNILGIVVSILIPVLIGAFIMLIIPQTSIIGFLTLIVLYSFIYFIFLYRFGMNKSEREIISSIINRIKKMENKTNL